MKQTKNDSLGDRMKAYEATTQATLPRRTHTIIRIDGRAFHTLTKKLGAKKPFDYDLIGAMDETALGLCQDLQGVVLAYVQSDEISLLLTDYADVNTQPWFGGNVQKMVSVSASIATAHFNQAVARRWSDVPLATFDSRVFTIPDRVEVVNYFLWRMRDWERNSLQMMARAYNSHKSLQGKKHAELHDAIHAHGENWNDLPGELKRGRLLACRAIGGWDIQPMLNFPEQREEFEDLIPTRGY